MISSSSGHRPDVAVLNLAMDITPDVAVLNLAMDIRPDVAVLLLRVWTAPGRGCPASDSA